MTIPRKLIDICMTLNINPEVWCVNKVIHLHPKRQLLFLSTKSS